MKNVKKDVEGSKPVHKMKIEKDLSIPMRDGVKIASDVYRPDALKSSVGKRGSLALSLAFGSFVCLLLR